MNGTCETKEEQMKKYLNKVRRLVKKFKEASFIQVPMEENVEADALVKEPSADGSVDEFDEVQYMPSIDLPEIQHIEVEESWMTLIVTYLKGGRLPKERDEVRKLRIR